MQKDNTSHEGVLACQPLGFQTSPLLRILLVEDDSFIRDQNTSLLLRSGYDVDAVEDGAAAWDTIQQESSYDLLLTDNRMPKVTGVELLQKLHGAGMTLPVILTTGASPEEELARSPANQPAAVLLKPYTFPELLRTVRKVLRELEIPICSTQMLMDLDTKDRKSAQAGELGAAQPPHPTRSLQPASTLANSTAVDALQGTARNVLRVIRPSPCAQTNPPATSRTRR